MSLGRGTDTKVGGGQLFPPGSLVDAELGGRLGQYRRVVAGRYRALRPEDLGELPPGTLWVTPKIDGELWFAVRHAAGVSLVAPNGRVLEGALPVLEELAAGFGERAGEGEVVAGELFAAQRGGGRPRVGDVARALGEGGDPGTLGFVAFDLVCGPGGEAPPEAWGARRARLEALLGAGRRAQVVKAEEGQGAEGVSSRFAAWVEGGKAEGLVVRAADGRIFKVKPTFSLDVAVLGFTVREEDETQARSLLLGVLREDGCFQILGSVGNLGSDEARRALLGRVAGEVVPSDYRAVASTGELFRFVTPSVVIEVACTDLQSTDGEGEATRQWALAFGEGGWRRVGPVAGASLIHPVLVGVREDKQAVRPDIRAEQLTERVAIGDLARKVEAEALSASTVVRREVYTKAVKGQVAVRKLLVWKTEKEHHNPDFPAFVVHWTDFSAGRKTPLEREVRVAPTREEADRIAEALLANEIGKGWARVG
jgi:hypothetical protein